MSHELFDIAENDMKYCTAINRRLLMPIGIWPIDPSANLIEKILFTTRIIICYLFIFFLLIPCYLHTFIVEEDPRSRFKMFGPLVFCTSAILKYSVLLSKNKNIAKCLDHMFTDWQQTNSSADREIMLASVELSRFILTVCAIFMYSGGFFYCVITPLSFGKLIIDNTSTRVLAFPLYKPFFSANDGLPYAIVLAAQATSGFIIYTITIGTCGLAAIFAFHACGQLGIIMNRLQNLVDGQNSGETSSSERIVKIVRLHLRVLGLIARVEAIVSGVCFIEFLGCMTNICLVGYYLMTEFSEAATIGSITYCALLVSITFNIFIFCCIGEMLSQKCRDVGLTAYTTEWYKLPNHDAKGLILLLSMTKFSTTITAGKIAELSYQSFSSILRSAFGYFNVLRNIGI